MTMCTSARNRKWTHPHGSSQPRSGHQVVAAPPVKSRSIISTQAHNVVKTLLKMYFGNFMVHAKYCHNIKTRESIMNYNIIATSKGNIL